MRAAVLVAGAALACLPLAACESTQSKSARLAKQAKHKLTARGVVVKRANRRVEVLSTGLLSDQYGSAAVVELRSRSKRPLARLPISIAVLGRGGRRLFANDAPGLQRALVEVPLLEPRRPFVWVNDQVRPSGKPKRLRAKVGAALAAVPRKLPRIRISDVRLQRDPVSGTELRARVENRSKVLQVNLVVFGVALRGGRVAAAGRALVPKLKPGAHARFSMFFIGNPAGARLLLEAPPTVLS